MEETVMRRKIMVLFDPETEYAVRFMEYISRKGSIPLEIHVFTDFDRVKAYIMGGRAEILLVSERVMSDEISGWPVERIIILYTAKASRGESSFRGKGSAPGCIPKLVLPRPD